MKIEEFKQVLRASLQAICNEKKWTFDNPKQRGMAFEDWCFNLFSERYPGRTMIQPNASFEATMQA
jgi:hypothetical protein